jgi:hypothetical protein
MYKAGTILKALKSGEQPPRGNPFEPEEEKNQDPYPQEQQEQYQPPADQSMNTGMISPDPYAQPQPSNPYN